MSNLVLVVVMVRPALVFECARRLGYGISVLVTLRVGNVFKLCHAERRRS